MLEIKIPENNPNYSQFEKYVTKACSFAVTGLTTILRLLLVKKIREISGKKVLFITSTEQNALRYQNDFEKAFDIETQLIPFQNISMYEGVSPNYYDYAEQVRILSEKPDIVITPVKSLFEKFPTQNFYDNNSIFLKIGDEIDVKDIAQKFVDLGYKRSTMVSDIGEFSIRGDIIDFYSLDKHPVRIELWGDEIVDIRYFDNETQKSIKKIKSTKIMPMYKFIIEDKMVGRLDYMPDNAFPSELLSFLAANNGYFEGVEVYQSYFNNNLIGILDYFQDYILVFDETSEIYSKYEFTDKTYEEQLQENLKLNLNAELKDKNHFTYQEFMQKISGFVKVGLNNFIDSEMFDVVEFNSQPVQNFGADLDKIAEFVTNAKSINNTKINSEKDFAPTPLNFYASDIIIATDYPERVKEILAERNIYDVKFTQSISAPGTILEDFNTVILTDRELFNKRTKEVTASKRSYYKEKPEFIESINDIKEGEFVVHSIHGVGIYKGLSQQEIDGQLKDYLTIEYANKDRLHIPAEQINLLVRYRGSGALKPKLSRMGGKDWENTKTRVKKEVEQVAYDLLRLYAKRKMQKGIQFLPDTTWQVEMEEAFEYTETPDQMKAINDIKNDMESEQPMDRLICGDVGF